MKPGSSFAYYICLLFVALSAPNTAQTSQQPYSQHIDSIKQVLKTAAPDSVILLSKISLAGFYCNLSLDSAFAFAKQVEVNQTLLSASVRYKLLKLMSTLYEKKGRKDQALAYGFEALKIAEDNLWTPQKAEACQRLARLYEWQGKKDNVFKYFTLALEEAKKTKDKQLIISVLLDGSDYYFNERNYDKALELLNAVAAINPGFKETISYISPIGDMYRDKKDHTKAAYYYLKAIDLATAAHDTVGLMVLYNNMAQIPFDEHRYELAVNYYLKARLLARHQKLYEEVSGFEEKISDAYFGKQDYKNALNYADSALQFYAAKTQPEALSRLYKKRSEILFSLSRHKEAFEDLKKANTYQVIYSNHKTQNKIAELQAAILGREKDKKIVVLEKDRQIERIEKNNSRDRAAVLLVFVIALLIFVIFIFRSRTQLKKKNEIISEQKRLVEKEQHEIIESISYAKRLQEAILPPIEFVRSCLPDSFILYQPKDLVAGDFYWSEKINNLVFIAAADSTGHGVPGAMVSVICSTALNRAVKEFDLTETGKILDKARELVIETFEKSRSEVKDGMDISLLCVDSKNKTVFWSGANNPLWYIHNMELTEIKANKQPIGKTEYPAPFTTHKIDYKENTMFYLFTDGLPDQFGGPKGKKFKYKQFSELLIKVSSIEPQQQMQQINEAFISWKGDLEQVDDVCVIGVRL